MVIIFFPHHANGWKWSIFFQYQFSVILDRNKLYYIFNRRDVVDHLYYTPINLYYTYY